MKKLIIQVFVYLTLGIGVAIIGLLLIPTGALVMLVSMVWRGIDKLIRFMEGRGIVRGKLQETTAPEATEIVAQWEEC